MKWSAPARWLVRFINAHQHVLEIRRKEVGSSEATPPTGIRDLVARLYIAGEGLEIGALNGPLPLPEGVHVRYVDRLCTAGCASTTPGWTL